VLRGSRQLPPRLLVLLLGALTATALGAGGTAAARALLTARRALDGEAAMTSLVTVSPLPGTPAASAMTQISFLGGAGTRVLDVTVSGSASGRHSGRLEAYSTGDGESFIPARPFIAGEKVTVSARVREGGHTTTAQTHFTVSSQAPIGGAEFPHDPGNPTEVQRYLSAPALAPSRVQITTPARAGATRGDFFLAPYQGAGTPGPMIVDQSGNLIWFHPLGAGESATNFRIQAYEGRTVLTWWQGRILKLGFGHGVDEIYNTSYQPIAHVAAGNGYHADLHEFLLTPQGTAWIDAVDPVRFNLASVGGPRHGVVNDAIVQEIDVKTGLVMWEWQSIGHIPFSDSYAVPSHNGTPFDYSHVNSIDPGPSGQLLLSARNTWTVYDVDMHSGAFIWRIGGKHPTFKPGRGTVFRLQHDAAWQPGGLVSVFDNGYSVAGDTQSRGLLLDPNPKTRTVTLVKQFINPDEKLLTSSQGDLINLGDGNWLMGYGGLPNFTEFDSAGNVLFDATLGLSVSDYRTYLAPWSAQPKTLPSVAAQVGADGSVTVEASWNGATDVNAWQVLAGSAASALSPVATVNRSGFETTTTVGVNPGYLAVAALGSAGQVLATSAAITPTR
jgi:Arylsulfotransferase (ASST)